MNKKNYCNQIQAKGKKKEKENDKFEQQDWLLIM